MNGLDLILYALVFAGIIWLWFNISNRFVDWYCDSTFKSSISTCEYCSNIAITTFYADDIEQDVDVCERHLQEFCY